MHRSTERIIVSHAGVLPRPADLAELMAAGPDKLQEFYARVPSAVKEVVQQQVDCGVDVVNDGEQSKRAGFSSYTRERFKGIEPREVEPGQVAAHNVQGRDATDFPGFFSSGGGGFNRAGARPTGQAIRFFSGSPMFCTAPLEYVGQALVQQDIANLKAAIAGQPITDAFLPTVAPGTIEHWLYNEYYPSTEAFLFAIADTMREENKAITDAGLIVQIDDPDLPDGYQMFPEMSIAQYRDYAALRVEAINRSIRGLPPEQVRLHICWGSGHGPHTHDVPLKDILDIVLRVQAECFSIEAANPRHEHEYHVWEQIKLPAGKSFMPGVVGHSTDIIEHPELVAERLVRYAKLMGRENVIAGTDCGLGNRVGHPEIAWAKLKAMSDGAKLATKQLWG